MFFYLQINIFNIYAKNLVFRQCRVMYIKLLFEKAHKPKVVFMCSVSINCSMTACYSLRHHHYSVQLGLFLSFMALLTS